MLPDVLWLPASSAGVERPYVECRSGGSVSGTRPGPSGSRHDHPALLGLLGHWRGSTRLAAGPWGPERTVDAEVTYVRVAGGFAVAQSYHHVEADDSHFEGHGIFTVDRDHQDVFWYYVDSTGLRPGTPARCTWHGNALRAERHSDAGWTRHTIRVEADILTHITELRSGGMAAADAPSAGSASAPYSSAPGAGASGSGSAGERDGKTGGYTPFMTSRFHRVP